MKSISTEIDSLARVGVNGRVHLARLICAIQEAIVLIMIITTTISSIIIIFDCYCCG